MYQRWSTAVLSALLLAIFCTTGSSDEEVLPAVADTGIINVNELGNMGSHVFVPVGASNNMLRINHALFDFDIATFIPANAKINSATLEILVLSQGGEVGQNGDDFTLHLMTAEWTEGTGIGNTGEDTGDGATWLTSNGVDAWTTPGGDFDPNPIGTQLIDLDGISGTYTINSQALVDAIQDIVNGDADDFGFLVKGVADVPGSGSRFGSRDNNEAATLTIDFTSDEVLLGDVNLDGMVTLADIPAFVELLSKGGFQAEADIDGNLQVDLADIPLFVAILSGG